MGKIRTAVVGCGKMGGIHCKVLSQLERSELVGVADSDIERAKVLGEKFGCEGYGDISELYGKVDAVTISTPTVSHLEIAKGFIEHGASVMIEKPLSANSKQGREIVELGKKHGVVVAVGHSERCNPVVQSMKRLDIEPKFIECQRISPYPFRSTDVGVVLDVMIHDIDIILSLSGSKLERVEAVGVNVIDENEDICNARLVFENGCIANVTASRLALKTERRIRVFSRQAYLSMDYFRKSGIVIKADPNTDLVKWIKEKQGQGDFDFGSVSWPELLHIEEIEIDDREPLRVEQESFLDAVVDGSKRPEVTGEEGLAAIECAEQILESIKGHSWE